MALNLEEMQAKIEELEGALSTVNGEAKDRRLAANDLKDRLAKFDGIDVDAVKALQAEAEKLKADKLKDAGKYDEALAEGLKTKDAELETVKALLSSQNAEMSTMKIDNEFTMGLNGGAVNNEQALILAKSNIKMEEGKAVVYKGDAPMVDGKGERVTVREYAALFLAENPHLAKAGDPGSGSRGNGGDGGDGVNSITRAEYDKLSPAAQSEHCKKGKITD